MGGAEGLVTGREGVAGHPDLVSVNNKALSVGCSRQHAGHYPGSPRALEGPSKTSWRNCDLNEEALKDGE